MKALLVDKVAFHRQTVRGVFPFELSRKTRAGPIRVSVSFKIADVRDRFGFVDRTETGKGEVPPFPIAFFPIKRRLPALFVDCRPA